MSDDSKIDQSNSHLGPNAKQAARDIVTHIHGVDHNLTYLVKQYFENKDVEDALKINSRLLHYMSPNDVEVEGLEKKMEAANREELLDLAKNLKHDLAKQIEKVQFSKSGQDLYLYLLNACYDRFTTYVYPRIKEGDSKTEVDKIFLEEVILPIVTSIAENPLHIMNDDIKAAIYYLTGNCHIRWD